jgi:multiple antibiotic resistance protein
MADSAGFQSGQFAAADGRGWHSAIVLCGTGTVGEWEVMFFATMLNAAAEHAAGSFRLSASALALANPLHFFGRHAQLAVPTVNLTVIEHSAYVRFSLLALSSIFFLVDPFAALPTFLAVTAGMDRRRRRRMAQKASLTAFVVLTAFALAGQYIFRMFGITLPAFEIAGGIILLLIGLDMLNAKRSPTQETGEDVEDAAAKEDAGIVPLGIPMLAGPGSITSVMVLVGQAQGQWSKLLAIVAAILITALICWLVLGNSDRVANVLGQTGIRILVRIMGLLLVALAVQYFVNGAVDLGLVARPGG